MEKPVQNRVEEKLSLSYLGQSDDNVTGQLMGLSKSFIDGKTALKKISNKVSYLIAESFQNIIRHGIPQDEGFHSGPEPDFFQINFLADRIIISSKNLIENENIQLLEDRIDHLNELSDEDLKDIWRKTLNEGKRTPKGGAGLGIIDMARKSGLPLKKRFIQIDESYSRFFLGFEITNQSDRPASKLDISEIVNQYKEFVQKGLLVSYTGDYSGETNSFLIQILHNNLIDEEAIESTAVENLTIIIEVIQNISKHGARRENQIPGGFSMFEKDGAQYIRAHNYIGPGEYQAFSELLRQMKSKNLDEIKTERKRKMLEENSSAEGNGGLGLLEIGIFTENKFEYTFEKTNSELYMFSIALKLKNHG